MIQDYFPGIPLLPSIGNNDVQYHDEAPTLEEAPSYYNDMWNSMFVNVAANQNYV
jgi:hypothetical protein